MNSFAFRDLAREQPRFLRHLKRTGWVGTPDLDPAAYDADIMDDDGAEWERADDWFRFVQDQLLHYNPDRMARDWQLFDGFLADNDDYRRAPVERGWVEEADPGIALRRMRERMHLESISPGR